jgi:hypothetical protein
MSHENTRTVLMEINRKFFSAPQENCSDSEYTEIAERIREAWPEFERWSDAELESAWCGYSLLREVTRLGIGDHSFTRQGLNPFIAYVDSHSEDENGELDCFEGDLGRQSADMWNDCNIVIKL